MTPAVRCGFWIVKLDPSGSVVSFAFQNPWSQTRIDTFNAFDEIFSIPDQIRRYLAVIGRNLGQISTDPARFRLDLAGFSQKSFSTMKPDTWTDTTQNQRDSNWKIQLDHPGQFQVIFSSTWIIRVRSWLGTNPTRPYPWTPLTRTNLKVNYNLEKSWKKKKKTHLALRS